MIKFTYAIFFPSLLTGIKHLLYFNSPGFARARYNERIKLFLLSCCSVTVSYQNLHHKRQPQQRHIQNYIQICIYTSTTLTHDTCCHARVCGVCGGMMALLLHSVMFYFWCGWNGDAIRTLVIFHGTSWKFMILIFCFPEGICHFILNNNFTYICGKYIVRL